MIIVLLNDDVNPIKCKGCISTMKQYKCKQVNRGVNNFKYSKILHIKKEIQAACELDCNMKTRKTNVSCVWGRCHSKHCCALMPYTDVSVWLHCLFLITEAETSSANKRDAPWEQGVPRFLRVTASLAENHRGSLAYARLHLSPVHWLDMAAVLSDPFTKVATLECVHTHTHTRSQELFLCLTLYFISFLTSSHSQTESTRSQIFVFLHPAFWTFWPLMEISLPWKLFR